MSIDKLDDIIEILNKIVSVDNINEHCYEEEGFEILDLSGLSNSEDLQDGLSDELAELEMALGFYMLEENGNVVDKASLAKMKKAGYDVKKIPSEKDISGGYTHYVKTNDFNIMFSY